MKSKEIHEMTTEELNAQLTSLKSKLFYLRFDHAVGQLNNPKQLTTVKKDIARVKTVLRERELNIVRQTSPVKTKGSAKV